MGKHDSLERMWVQRLIDKAERLGAGDQVPQVQQTYSLTDGPA